MTKNTVEKKQVVAKKVEVETNKTYIKALPVYNMKQVKKTFVIDKLVNAKMFKDEDMKLLAPLANYVDKTSKDVEQAEKKLESYIDTLFTTKKPRKAVKAEKPKEDKKKQDKPKAEKKPKEPKHLHHFKHFCEVSEAYTYPVTEANHKLVKDFHRAFELLHKSLHAELSEKDEKELAKLEKPLHAFLTRNSVRIVLTETDSKNKLVQHVLLKPLYMSPYSLTTVVEAHERDTKKKSMYDSHLNTYESTMSVYDAFQFQAFDEYLSTNDNIDTKLKHKVTYQFVNIITK